MVEEKIRCPECGSENVVKAGFIIRKTGKRQRRKCQACGITFYWYLD